jgi:hypothetical protein
MEITIDDVFRGGSYFADIGSISSSFRSGNMETVLLHQALNNLL